MTDLTELVESAERLVSSVEKAKLFYCHREGEYQNYFGPEEDRNCPHDGTHLEFVPGRLRKYRAVLAPHQRSGYRLSKEIKRSIRANKVRLVSV